MESRSRKTRVSIVSDREVLITRELRAPQALVFEMWTKPEHVRRWYGCAVLAMTICEIDLRVGGAWRWVLRNTEDGSVHGFSGEYREILPSSRLSYTERYEPIPGSERIVTHAFEERDGVTTLTSHSLYASKAQRDGHLQSGMETGLDVQFDRLEALATGP